MLRQSLAIALFVVIAQAAPARAQDTLPVARGTPVRYVTFEPPHGWRYGVIERLTRDSVWLRARDAQQGEGEARRRLDLVALEVNPGGHGSRATHVLVGIGTGLLVGAGVLVAGVHHCEATDRQSEGPPCAIGYVALPFFAAIGGSVGGLIGALLPAERWHPVRF